MDHAKSQTTSFSQWLENTTIEIPLLQRDYAQGRTDEKTKAIRKEFVEDLVQAINGGKKIHLDFIYGPSTDGIFHPLDGQQRLTTLFLLHWYLATKTGNLADTKFLKNFRYKVRTTTQEFIDALLVDENLKNTELDKKDLLDAKWYYSAWDYDPTVLGMLNMIDELNKQLTGKDLPKLWNNLVSSENPPITFTVLDMKQFDLGDELYMRMNARGLPLSDFENFKAWMEGELENKQIQGDWKKKLDGEWTNLFWKLSDNDPKKTGDLFFQYFKAVALNAFVLNKETNIEKDEKTRTLIRHLAGNAGEYIEENLFSNTFKLTKEQTIQEAFRYLDIAAPNKDRIKNLPQFETPLFREQKSPTDWLREGFDAYPDRVLFFTYYQYIFKFGFKYLNNWMRFVRNLVINTTIDAPAPFYRAIRSLNQIIKNLSQGENIFDQLANRDLKITGFSEEQIKEEQIKAKLRIQSKGWENLIKNAEDHLFFKGRIRVMLKLAGLYSERDHVAVDYRELEKILSVMQILFEVDADNKDKNKPTRQIQIQRALLSEGDYVPWKSGDCNYTFCNNRDEWMSFFDTKENSRFKVFQSFIQELIGGDISVDDNLKSIIENNVNKINDWRYFFIKRPECITACGQGLAAFPEEQHKEDDYFKIRMLNTSTTAGGQKELRSFFVFKSLTTFDQSPFKVVRYHCPSGINSKPCIVLDHWTPPDSKDDYALEIYFDETPDNTFTLRLFERSKKDIPHELAECFNGFSMKSKAEWIKKITCNPACQDDINGFIKEVKILLEKL